jgi:hypothetical protein
MWWERLQGGQRIVEDWQKIIQVHTLVISPQDDMYTWLKYASLCRKNGNLMLCHKTLVMLLGIDPSQSSPDQPLPTQHPQVLSYALSVLYPRSEHGQIVHKHGNKREKKSELLSEFFLSEIHEQ